MSDRRPDSDQTPEPSAASELKRTLLAFARDFPFFRHMGFVVEDMEPGYARVSVELTDHLRNPNGQMHGGVIATLGGRLYTELRNRWRLTSERVCPERCHQPVELFIEVLFLREVSGVAVSNRGRPFASPAAIEHEPVEVDRDQDRLTHFALLRHSETHLVIDPPTRGRPSD